MLLPLLLALLLALLLLLPPLLLRDEGEREGRPRALCRVLVAQWGLLQLQPQHGRGVAAAAAAACSLLLGLTGRCFGTGSCWRGSKRGRAKQRQLLLALLLLLLLLLLGQRWGEEGRSVQGGKGGHWGA